MTLRTLSDVTGALERYLPGPNSMRKNYTLDRMHQLLSRVGNPQESLRIAHVAGTSGKTSTAYFLRALLEEAGCKTGLAVSPHIVSVKERAQVGGTVLTDELFATEIDRFLGLIKGHDDGVTYFELLVAFAYWEFARVGVDYAVIEVGLGGLLDGTNTSTRRDKLCVISDIGLDHTEILGDTIELIAAQKAGIIHPGNHVVTVKQDKEAEAAIEAVVAQQGATLSVVDPALTESNELPFFQRRNFALAAGAYDYLLNRDGLRRLATQSQLRAASAAPPARMERFQVAGMTIVIDGAHNPQKLEALRQALNESAMLPCTVIANLIVAPDQKIDDALRIISKMATHLVIPEFFGTQDFYKKGMDPSELVERARRLGVKSVESAANPARALEMALRQSEYSVLVTGSLYLASAIRRLVSENED